MNAELQKLYAQLPEVHCKGLCQDSCGPIGMSAAEYQELRAKVGDRIRGITDSSGMVLVANMKTLTCPLLNPDGKCACYDIRPLICRLFGAVKEMQCPNGCIPDRWVKREESYALMSRVEAME